MLEPGRHGGDVACRGDERPSGAGLGAPRRDEHGDGYRGAKKDFDDLASAVVQAARSVQADDQQLGAGTR